MKSKIYKHDITNLKNMLQKFKTYLEGVPITPTSWLAAVSGILMIRFFLESLSSPTLDGLFAADLSTIIHYYLFFLTFALIFILFVKKFIGSFAHVAEKLVVLSLIAIFIAPVIDYLISGGKGMKMAYLFDSPGQIFNSLVTFFGPSLSQGITLGIRIEVSIVLLSLLLFIYFAERSMKKAVFGAVAMYFIAFIMVSLPGIFSLIAQGGTGFLPVEFLQNAIIRSETILNNIPPYLKYTSDITLLNVAFNFLMSKILLLLSIVFAFAYFYRNHKEKFVAIIKNSRPERVAHYFFMIFLGMFAAYSLFFPFINFNWIDVLSVVALLLSFYFSWMYAVCVNDNEDVAIDEVTNQERPLVKGAVSAKDMKQASSIFLFATLLSGYIAGFSALFFVLAFTALYYVYSANPSRLKLIPFFSSFLIALCCLAAVLAGFYLISPVKNLSVFPDKLTIAIVLLYFLFANIRDMKDIEGDKKAGIKTVPILFGDVWGPRLVGSMAGLSFLLVPVLLGIYTLFIAAVPAALAIYFYITRKPYVEKPVFNTYISFIIASIILLLV